MDMRGPEGPHLGQTTEVDARGFISGNWKRLD
jgi:hypothetical protein